MDLLYANTAHFTWASFGFCYLGPVSWGFWVMTVICACGDIILFFWGPSALSGHYQMWWQRGQAGPGLLTSSPGLFFLTLQWKKLPSIYQNEFLGMLFAYYGRKLHFLNEMYISDLFICCLFPFPNFSQCILLESRNRAALCINICLHLWASNI